MPMRRTEMYTSALPSFPEYGKLSKNSMEDLTGRRPDRGG